MKFKVFKMDVKSVFLSAKLQEEVYFEQPQGFTTTSLTMPCMVLSKLQEYFRTEGVLHKIKINRYKS